MSDLQQGTKPIPRLREIPLVGSALAYNRDRLRFYRRILHECGDAGRVHFGPLRTNLFGSPTLIGIVLADRSEDFGISPVVQEAFDSLASNGLITSKGDYHRHQRKLMAPLFQPRSIMQHAETIVQYGEGMQQKWKTGESIDIHRQMVNISMSIIGNVLFGTDFGSSTAELERAMEVVLDYTNARLAYPLPSVLARFLPSHYRMRKAATSLRTMIQSLIDIRREEGVEKSDLLSTLLHADGREMNDEQLFDESVTLVFAGHETVAHALSWTWMLRKEHPDIYQRVREEVDTVLQGRTPTYADLARLPYCLQVLKETLRLYPPIHAIVRDVQRDRVVGEFRVKRGETIVISPYVIHHRADYFSDPEKFDPERFTPEGEKQRVRYSYIPFGAGPRLCIGMHLALMEGHFLLATLAQRVIFDPKQKVIPDPKVTLGPKSVLVVVRRRETT